MINYEIIERLSKLEISEKVSVTLKGFVHSHRIGKTVSFLVLRQGQLTLQCVYTKKDLKSEESSNSAVCEDNNKKVFEKFTKMNAKQATETNEKQPDKDKTVRKSKKQQSKKIEVFSEPMSRYILYTKIPVESYVKVRGYLSKSPVPILSCSVHHLELQISSIEIVSLSSDLPFTLKTILESDLKKNSTITQKGDQVDTTSLEKNTRDTNKDKNSTIIQKGNQENASSDNTVKTQINTKLETYFDNRFLDLRLPHTQSIFTVIDGFYSQIRKFMKNHNFIEIKTPKIIQGSTEGGCNLFSIEYFKKTAYLAQSPQLYKQMAVIGGLQRIFEIGHVYRQEESNTNRYLSEFIGLDLEFEVESHHDVIDMVHSMIKSIFNGVNQEYQNEIDIIRSYCSFEDAVIHDEPVVLSFVGSKRLLDLHKKDKTIFSQSCDEFSGQKNMHEDTDSKITDQIKRDPFNHEEALQKKGQSIKENKIQPQVYSVSYLKEIAEATYRDTEIDSFIAEIPDLLKDFNREEEKTLGQIVKNFYKTDLFVVHEYPTKERAFYTSAKDSIFSNSFDFILRGEEILSGALRIHDLQDLKDSLKSKNISEESLDGYLKAFRNGVPIHGGCGIGFERMVKCFFSGTDIRMFTMFPRDPNRLYP